MVYNPFSFIESADVGAIALEGLEAAEAPKLDLSTLPDVVVSSTTLIDFSATPNVVLRASVSLALLYASRVATRAMKPEDDEDDWLARYNQALSEIGFRVSGYAVAHSTFKKKNVAVHKAIIPFLTIAFGGAAVGPIILQALKNLQEMDADAPWITLFDRESRRFNVNEMHFAAVSSNDTETTIRYAVARLNVESSEVRILFFKISDVSAEFESATTTMTCDNGLLAALEPKLKAKLISQIDDRISGAEV
ncbi:hypothetical protein [Asticcacaulis benevestitus]|uniref:Uncharacterized protein n=1 Tax=Asticcacaulis benevestitus DSM 16100 = ATCC BAA-896 TaxID=1121022 RepID=V4RMY6_9CAUL|nr:hypothetical protein [Asticcacaulis benevestitus]ESQ92603.1 hypothetical protein ABENE_08170 [Asticcacaulis benevestitus DSM 16100 = ATCC BAA-896]